MKPTSNIQFETKMCEEKEGFCKQRHPVIKGELAQIKWRSQISAKFGQGQVLSPETMWKLFCWKKSCTHTNSSLLSLIVASDGNHIYLQFWELLLVDSGSTFGVGWRRVHVFFSNLKYPPAPPFTTTCTKTGKSHKSHRGGHLSNFHPG